ncbi:hypothetical protein Elgi_25250 [Paenibacillus elgii]|uniref:hypothetical protein n=1 Tax=Paenibacillus elgii TaxID=189691 RepID=UPI002D7DE2CC|nr:hypothetical protein Elgi_25250 [Paenibacillus elgii]
MKPDLSGSVFFKFKESYVKPVALLSVVSLLGSLLGGTASAAAVENTNVSYTAPTAKNQNAESRLISIGKDEVSAKVLKAVPEMNNYISLGADNLYHIDPAAQEVVDAQTYSLFELGVSRLNTELIKNPQLLENAANNSNVVRQFSPTGDIGTNAYSNSYWWGVAVTFDDGETKHQIYTLQQTGTVAALLAALLAFIPAAQAGAITAAIISAGALMIANSMSYWNQGRGVTLNLHWLPFVYYEVTSNN